MEGIVAILEEKGRVTFTKARYGHASKCEAYLKVLGHGIKWMACSVHKVLTSIFIKDSP
jgi:hypothetical protein